MANLVLKDVSKLYPSGALALCNVNLEFSDREFVAVVGGEKSGKSTLLRVIAGLEEPTSGQIIIGDKDYTGTPPKFRDVAMIFRNDTLSPNLTVYDNLAFGLRARKSPEILVDKRVRAAAKDFPSYGIPRAVAVVREPFTVEEGLLTPTMKPKRKNIAQKYAHLIEALYAGHKSA